MRNNKVKNAKYQKMPGLDFIITFTNITKSNCSKGIKVANKTTNNKQTKPYLTKGSPDVFRTKKPTHRGRSPLMKRQPDWLISL